MDPALHHTSLTVGVGAQRRCAMAVADLVSRRLSGRHSSGQDPNQPISVSTAEEASRRSAARRQRVTWHQWSVGNRITRDASAGRREGHHRRQLPPRARWCPLVGPDSAQRAEPAHPAAPTPTRFTLSRHPHQCSGPMLGWRRACPGGAMAGSVARPRPPCHPNTAAPPVSVVVPVQLAACGLPSLGAVLRTPSSHTDRVCAPTTDD